MTQRKSLNGLQAVRGVAALLVVWDHAYFTLQEKAGAAVDLAFASFLGDLGVCIFFVISGFVMVLAHQREFGDTGATSRFLLRRFGRIAPLYWLATLVYVAKLTMQHKVPSAIDLALSMAFVPHAPPAGGFYGHPVYGLGWTLQYEMFFYLIFAMTLLLSFKQGFMALAAFFSIFVGMGVTGAMGTANPAAYLAHPIILLFVVGMVLGALRNWLNEHGSLPKGLGFRSAVAGSSVILIATIVIRYRIGLSITPIAAILVVALCGLSSEDGHQTRLTAISSLIGDAAYSIYLTHSFVLGPAGRLVGRLWPAIPVPLFVLSMIVAASVVGLLCYHLVEKPVLRLWIRLVGPRGRTLTP